MNRKGFPERKPQVGWFFSGSQCCKGSHYQATRHRCKGNHPPSGSVLTAPDRAAHGVHGRSSPDPEEIAESGAGAILSNIYVHGFRVGSGWD